MAMRVALVSVLVIAIAPAALAAQAVSGRTDIIVGRVQAPNGEPLAGALVTANSIALQKSRMKQTDANGRYTILFPDGGPQYQVTVTSAGMVPLSMTVARVADEDRLEANFKMALVPEFETYQANVLQAIQQLQQQLQQMQAGRLGDDPLARHLYPPELLLAHQEAIALSGAQRTAVQQAMMASQTQSLNAQLKLASATEQLAKSLSAATVDEAAALQLVDQVLAAEREVKRAQLVLLVRVKNQLSAEQQAALDKWRKQNGGGE
jgi:hypothetical protein